MSAATISRGDIVRSILNGHTTYRVQKLGPKRAVLVVHDSPGFYRFYCSPSLLRKA